MKEITITISAQTLNTIGAALNELPYKIAAPAIQEIDAQVQQALKDRAESENGAQ